jgi:hypothetical protein
VNRISTTVTAISQRDFLLADIHTGKHGFGREFASF